MAGMDPYGGGWPLTIGERSETKLKAGTLNLQI